MKGLLSFAISILLVGSAGLALAQDNNAAGGATAASNAPAASTGTGIPEHPGKVIAGRIKNQYKRIREGVKSKKLTKDEAKDLKSKVDAVRDQLKADAAQDKQGGEKKITDDQYTQLKQMLDDNSKAIHDDKNDGETDVNSAPSAAAPATETAPTTASGNQ